MWGKQKRYILIVKIGLINLLPVLLNRMGSLVKNAHFFPTETAKKGGGEGG